MVTTITNSGLSNSSTIEPKGTTVVVSGFGTGRTKDSKDKFTANGINNLKIVDSSNKIKQNGFSSFKVVPATGAGGGAGSFEERFDVEFDRVSSSVIDALAAIQRDANNIKNTVINMSNNLTTNYLSKAELTSYDNINNITSAIKEQTATFVTAEQAGGWYGLTLESDVKGKKYITGFDMGSIVYPESGINDSYFRINADRFIVGGDIGDGEFGGPLDENGEPIPAFSIVQDGTGSPQMYFNGKVNIESIPESVTKLLGKFAHISELNSYLAMHPEIVVRDGDSYLNTSENIVYFWDGDEWISAEGKVSYRSIVFKRSNTKPAPPIGGNYSMNVPAGWSDGIPPHPPGWKIGTAVTPVWASYTEFDNKTDYTTNPPVWTDPILTLDSETTDYIYHSSETVPPTPTNTTDDTSIIQADINNGWYNEARLNTVWAAVRHKQQGVWSAWEISRIRGENGINGANGQNGADGSRGSSILHGSGSGSFSASAASRAFNNKFGNVINGDQYIWTSTNSGTVIRTYNGSTWVDNTALTVHGDAVVNGTIYANKLASNAIRSKTATFDNTDGSVTGYNSGSTWAVAVTGGPLATGGLSAQGYTTGVGGYTRGDGSLKSGVFGLSDDIHGGTGKGTGVYGYSYYNRGVWGRSKSGVGVYASSESNWGIYTPNAIYAANFSPFTGSHIAYTKKIKNNPVVGDIYCSDDAWAIDVSQPLVHARISNKKKDTTVFGVVRSINDVMTNITENELISREVDGKWSVRPKYQAYVTHLQENGFVEIMVNALGGGGINVCEINGNILNGAYITSSTVPGKGMKQDDDLMHNYTVAKALEDVIWDDEIVGEGGCFKQDGYKCKMIACTYHCG